MHIIQPCNNFIFSVIGKQKISKKCIYRPITYCFFKYYKNNILLFNNLTKELLSFKSQELSNYMIGNYCISDPIIQLLIEKYFLVPLEHDDVKLCDQLREITKKFDTDQILTMYTIVTTTACNARCFYCFEAGAETTFMSEKTSNSVADYIIKHCGNKRVILNWFGGEPLCNIKPIDIITNQLDEAKIEYISQFTTNGYLFNKNLIQHAREQWKINSVQITLDGMSETYSAVKNYKNGDVNAFEHVIDNVHELLNENIKVIIRMNLDNYNFEELCELSDYLYNTFYKYENFSMYAHPLFENSGYMPIKRQENEKNLLGENFMKLRWKIHKMGMWRRGTVLPKKLKIISCMADNKHAVLISTDGKIGRCDRFVNSHFLSDIYSDYKISNDNQYIKKCNSCYLCSCYPSCLKLSNCPSAQKNCPWYLKRSKELEIQEQMISTYIKSLVNN